jgi:hypothetical protein
MKTFDLHACGVEEMTQCEMLEIDGGNIFGDAWNWIRDAAEDVGEWAEEAFEDACEWIGGAAEDVWAYMNAHDNGAPEGGGQWGN